MVCLGFEQWLPKHTENYSLKEKKAWDRKFQPLEVEFQPLEVEFHRLEGEFQLKMRTQSATKWVFWVTRSSSLKFAVMINPRIRIYRFFGFGSHDFLYCRRRRRRPRRRRCLRGTEIDIFRIFDCFIIWKQIERERVDQNSQVLFRLKRRKGGRNRWRNILGPENLWTETQIPSYVLSHEHEGPL